MVLSSFDLSSNNDIFTKTTQSILGKPILSIKDISGNINNVVLVNNSHIIRWQKFKPYSFEDIGSNENAIKAMDHVRKYQKTIPLPKNPTLHKDTTTSFLVLQKMPGITLLNLIRKTNNPEKKTALAKKMAHTLSGFHTLKAPQWGAFSPNHTLSTDTWFSYVISWVEHQVRHLLSNSLINGKTAKRIIRVFYLRKNILSLVKNPVFIHEELNPQNILVDNKGNVTSILDFDKAKGGDPLADFSITLLNCLLDVDDDFVKVFSDEYLHVYNNNLSVHKEKIHKNSDIITLYTLFYTLKLFPVAYQYKFPNFEKYPAEVMRLLSSLE